MEWYDPAAITTKGGALEITLSQKETHGLNYEGGMMSTWNKFCFTGGLIETAVTLPGMNNIAGLWPAIWTMGNLGRMPLQIIFSDTNISFSQVGPDMAQVLKAR